MAKELGDVGEEVVRQYEKKNLEGLALFELASKVKIAMDGEGYDVLSFDEQGREKFIEVKTTIGGPDKPFFLTRHEIRFMRSNSQQYSLYRLFHFNEQNGSSDYFELRGNTENLILLDQRYMKLC